MSILVFGATGYTGRLTVAALVRRGLRPVLAGRNSDRLGKLANEHGGLATRVADIARPSSVRALLEPDDVMLTCVGPFSRWGAIALEAALDAGAHYLDSCGEPGFVASVFEQYPAPAAAANVAVLTAFGHDYVPGHVAAGVALREAGDGANRVAVAYFLTGAVGFPSEGSAATMMTTAGEAGLFYRAGRLIKERTGRDVEHFEVDGRSKPAFSLPSTEHLFLPRTYPQLRTVDAYLGWFGPVSYAVPMVSIARQMWELWPGAQSITDAAVALCSSGRGPSAEARAQTGAHVVAIAYRDDEPLARADLAGVNVYDHTADLLAWGAEHINGTTQRGVLGPLEAFSLDDLIEANREAGFTLR